MLTKDNEVKMFDDADWNCFCGALAWSNHDPWVLYMDNGCVVGDKNGVEVTIGDGEDEVYHLDLRAKPDQVKRLIEAIADFSGAQLQKIGFSKI
jgi:hypothetical protein